MENWQPVGNRILVVDDEKNVREFLSIALTRKGGFYVDVAASGEEAVRKIEEKKFDLILADLKMPNMDGLQLITEVVKSKPDILAVLMTGYASIDSALDAMKSGASDYLIKPFNIDEMIVRLQKALKEKNRFMKLGDPVVEEDKGNIGSKELDEGESEFVSLASHELKTPLTVARSAIQLIREGKVGKVNSVQKKFLAMSETSINRLTAVVKNLLDLSIIKSGNFELRMEELELPDIVEFVLTSLKPKADRKSIQLETRVRKALPDIYGDREKVERILMSLVRNAIRSTPKGGKVSVSTFLGRKSTEVAIIIKDSCNGGSQHKPRKIFEKVHPTGELPCRSRNEVGLELAITKGLVEVLGGRIWMGSDAIEDHMIIFTLPMSKGNGKDHPFRFKPNGKVECARNNP